MEESQFTEGVCEKIKAVEVLKINTMFISIFSIFIL